MNIYTTLLSFITTRLARLVFIVTLLLVPSTSFSQYFYLNGFEFTELYGKGYSRENTGTMGLTNNYTLLEVAWGGSTFHGSVKLMELLDHAAGVGICIPYLYVSLYKKDGVEGRYSSGGFWIKDRSGDVETSTYIPGSSGHYNSKTLDEHFFLFAGTSYVSLSQLGSIGQSDYIHLGAEYFWNRLPYIRLFSGSLRFGLIQYVATKLDPMDLRRIQDGVNYTPAQTSIYLGFSIGIFRDWTR
ncbi:MAG: hypothetical protein EHM64_14255 [Ignavibacteriae bacterium]|nr:MAG: hypothetical protein EHM64_14255 [Ignavibacteriota bacterium]